MNKLKEYIQEKLIINKHSKIKGNPKWDDIINSWIEEWKNDDFEYLIDLIDNFLEDGYFNNYQYDGYDPLTKYEDDEEFMKYLENYLIQFKKDVDEQNKKYKK